MKPIILFALAFGFWCSTLSAFDVQVIPTRKKTDESQKRSGNATVEEKTIVYKVNIINRLAKELSNITVKYNIYYTDVHFGSKAKPEVKTASGKFEIPILLSNKPVEYETEEIKLGKASLDAGWYFTDGADGRARDKIVGLWFKVFNADGKQIGEYINPTTVSSKQEWKE